MLKCKRKIANLLFYGKEINVHNWEPYTRPFSIFSLYCCGLRRAFSETQKKIVKTNNCVLLLTRPPFFFKVVTLMVQCRYVHTLIWIS